jgi:hypothetical protein
MGLHGLEQGYLYLYLFYLLCIIFIISSLYSELFDDSNPFIFHPSHMYSLWLLCFHSPAFKFSVWYPVSCFVDLCHPIISICPYHHSIVFYVVCSVFFRSSLLLSFQYPVSHGHFQTLCSKKQFLTLSMELLRHGLQRNNLYLKAETRSTFSYGVT